MMDDNEVNLTLGDIGDDTDFWNLYNDWTVCHQIPLEPAALRTICRLWYGRGVARGTEWADNEIGRIAQGE